ncbi:MAG: tRNA glutamyl-Q synthetase [Verrucomicrobia bacterium]|nr:tRNA glutamyl-Q synthetase [Verrucomicrobiota bacterium]
MNGNEHELKLRKRCIGRMIRVHSWPFVVASPSIYRGRLAPSPTGYLHLGHARTFWVAAERARTAGGVLILRNEDLDAVRFRLDFADAMIEDLRWLGLAWQEGPDVGGPYAPYNQSERRPLYRQALAQLHAAGLIFPCTRSRRDVLEAIGAPHEGGGPDDEPVYPKEFRPPPGTLLLPLEENIGVNWRLRVPDGETIAFTDGKFGAQSAAVGRDFGDFLVWRKDDVPSYQLACAVDDAAMGITEVVRGADLIKSTFRQLLVYRALGKTAPAFFHCPLMNDDRGQRLAKRHDALSLRALRERGMKPGEIIAQLRSSLDEGGTRPVADA